MILETLYGKIYSFQKYPFPKKYDLDAPKSCSVFLARFWIGFSDL